MNIEMCLFRTAFGLVAFALLAWSLLLLFTVLSRTVV